MTTYYLCDLVKKTVLAKGPLPEAWGNMSGLHESNDECLKDMTWSGNPGLGFLKFQDLVSAGIPILHVASMKDSQSQEDLEIIRDERLFRIQSIRWRIERHQDELMMGKPPTEDITEVLNYVQALRDLTLQKDLQNVTWPVPPPIT